MPAPVPRPQVLSVGQVQAILDACSTCGTACYSVCCWTPGCSLRIGEVGVAHEDLVIAERQVRVVPRRNDNRARAKAGRSRAVLASVLRGAFRLSSRRSLRDYCRPTSETWEVRRYRTGP